LTNIGYLSPKDAWSLLYNEEKSILIDVRTRAEWFYVGVPDLSSLNKNLCKLEWVEYPNGNYNSNFLKVLEKKFKKDVILIFICRSGHRSALAAQAAFQIGFNYSYNLTEGFEGDLGSNNRRNINGWKTAGLPWSQT